MFERAGVPKHLRPLVGGKVNVDMLDRNWADIPRVAATMAAGTMRPSQILRKLAAGEPLTAPGRIGVDPNDVRVPGPPPQSAGGDAAGKMARSSVSSR